MAIQNECAAMQDDMVLLAAGELDDAQQHALERHVRSCSGCAAHQQELLALHQMAASRPHAGPTANQLAAARLSLDSALDQMPAPGPLARLRHAMQAWAYTLRSVPALASLLLVVGFAGGSVAGVRLATHAGRVGIFAGRLVPQSQSISALPQNVASISGITRQAGSNLVQVRYNRLVPEAVEGDASDPQIQQLLVLASLGRGAADVRGTSVDMLAGQCVAGRNCAGGETNALSVRQALMASLKFDKNPAVRRKALDGLAPYVAQDTSVRNLVLDAVLNDDNADVRMQAIQLLTPVEGDTSVRSALHHVATADANPYLRTVSQQTLQATPDMQ